MMNKCTLLDSLCALLLRLLTPAVVAGTGAAMIGCEQPDRIEIESSRKRFTGEQDPEFGLTAQQRFLKNAGTSGDSGMASQDKPPVNPFRWTTPEGWSENATSRMRVINLTFGPNGEGECYLTALPGDAGGIPMNVNRWRGQMGLPEWTAEEIAALPEKPLLGTVAKFVDLRGDFGGMTLPGAPESPTKSDYRMLGLIQQQSQFTFFVKMTGPAELVTANEKAFDSFTQSITIGAH